MKEIWKPIQDYENYFVSNFGRVKNSKGKIRKFVHDKKDYGYVRVALISKNKKQKNILVHRLVALAFIPNTENKSIVNHLNENKSDNRVENLEWSTLSENQRHGSCIDRRILKYYKKIGQYSLDGKLIKKFDSIKEDSIFYNITDSAIIQNLKGKTKTCLKTIWRYL